MLSDIELIKKIRSVIKEADAYTYDVTEKGMGIDGFIYLDTFKEIAKVVNESESESKKQ